ncbi:MAG: C26 family cysteine hydrolase domain-containing family [Bacilli bacterium]|nr:C26 family cysteine hydrolase domain-containing family [Bacilli bacterium]
MIKLKTKELHFDEELKKKIEFIRDFCNTKAIIINGSINNIEHTNLNYIEPHRVIIKGITFLVFNYSKTIYVGSLAKSLEIKDIDDNIFHNQFGSKIAHDIEILKNSKLFHIMNEKKLRVNSIHTCITKKEEIKKYKVAATCLLDNTVEAIELKIRSL